MMFPFNKEFDNDDNPYVKLQAQILMRFGNETGQPEWKDLAMVKCPHHEVISEFQVSDWYDG